MGKLLNYMPVKYEFNGYEGSSKTSLNTISHVLNILYGICIGFMLLVLVIAFI